MNPQISKRWEDRFISAAKFFAQWSRDNSLKVGAVIVGPDKEIRSTGYNDLPRGVNDEISSRFQSPAKDIWTEHAERNAIYNAARTGIPLLNCTLYCTMYPCCECARAIIQSGIKYVVVSSTELENKAKWREKIQGSREMFRESGVSVKILNEIVDLTHED